MLRYRKIKMSSENEQLNGKVFARAVIDQTIGIDQLAAHMAKHGTLYTRTSEGGIGEPVAQKTRAKQHFYVAAAWFS